jgi:hypothetical protein
VIRAQIGGIALPAVRDCHKICGAVMALGQSPKQVNRSIGDWNHVIRQSSSQIEAVNLAGVLSYWRSRF